MLYLCLPCKVAFKVCTSLQLSPKLQIKIDVKAVENTLIYHQGTHMGSLIKRGVLEMLSGY